MKEYDDFIPNSLLTWIYIPITCYFYVVIYEQSKYAKRVECWAATSLSNGEAVEIIKSKNNTF